MRQDNIKSANIDLRPGRVNGLSEISCRPGCIARVESYTQGMTEAAFLASSRVQDAVIRNLQTMAEATQCPSRYPNPKPDPFSSPVGQPSVVALGRRGGLPLRIHRSFCCKLLLADADL